MKGDDPEIYCNTHVPRIGGSGMSHEALGIRQAMQAQLDISSAAAARVAKIRHPDVAPSVDGEAMAIRSALSAQKRSQYGRQLHTSNIDAEALHIKGAMDAQRLQRRYQRKLDKHHFPPHIVSIVHAESQPCLQKTHAQTHASTHTHIQAKCSPVVEENLLHPERL